jgi:hypothetical protein
VLSGSPSEVRPEMEMQAHIQPFHQPRAARLFGVLIRFTAI